jgi:hypothetical protein
MGGADSQLHGRAAEQHNKLAPLHRADPKLKDGGSIAGHGRASQQKRPLNDRFGSDSIL